MFPDMHFPSVRCMHLDMDASTETNLDMDVSQNTCLYIDVSQDTHLFMYKGGRRRRMHSSHWPGYMAQGRGLGHAGQPVSNLGVHDNRHEVCHSETALVTRRLVSI
jgi:hypothetical protein